MIRAILAKLNINLPPLPTTPPPHPPPRGTLLQLSALILLATLAHFFIANPLVAGFALVIFIVKLAIIWQHKPTPSGKLITVLTVISFLLILTVYGGWNGQTAGVSFLVLLLSLKFLEANNLRDYYVVCIILYFLVACLFLFNASIPSIVLVLLTTVAITAILFKITTPTPLSWQFAMRSATSIILKAVPLALFLFFFFPRIQSDFGFLPSQDENSKQLLDRLRAGELATSAFDNALAFRVTFDGEVPNQQQRYWRSKVMANELNFQWKIAPESPRSQLSALRKTSQLDLAKGTIRYEILHETSSDKYLPYLDYVTGTSKGRVADDYSVSIQKQASSSFSYRGSSSLLPSLPLSSEINSRALITTTHYPSPRMQRLIEQWRAQADSPAQLVNVVYDYFKRNNFAYSLKPPALGNSRPFDDFFFDTKTGYCEHYASAFSTIMRWLNIPARVVVGYQGGYFNQAGAFLEVRYSDAHAWSEVFINNRWQRVDATATVSPERIEFGMEALIAMWDGDRLNSNITGRALSNLLQPTGVSRTMQWLGDNFKNLGYQWNKWIVNYDFNKQRELLEQLGLEHRNTLSTLITVLSIGSLAILALYFWQLMPRPRPLKPEQKLYLKFVQGFKRHGIHKELSDTPNDFAKKIIAHFPASAERVRDITQLYLQLRYAHQPNNHTMTAFKQNVKQFKLSNENPSTIKPQP